MKAWVKKWLWAKNAARACHIRRGLSFSQRLKFDDEMRPILSGGHRVAYPDALYHITAEDVRRALAAATTRPVQTST